MSGHPAADRISAFLAGDLPERDSVAVRAHVAQCEDCADVARELRQQVEVMSSLERPEPPVTLWASIEGAWERHPEARGRLDGGGVAWSWRSLLIGVAGGAVAVGVAVLVGRFDQRLAGTSSASSAPLSAPAADGRGLATAPLLQDPLLLEAENELARAAEGYAQAAARLRRLLEREQARWDPVQRARVAERLASLDEAVAHSRSVVGRDPADGSGAEMLFAAYQKQIDFLAEAVQRGSPSLDEGENE
jgi:hypothetical protein